MKEDGEKTITKNYPRTPSSRLRKALLGVDNILNPVEELVSLTYKSGSLLLLKKSATKIHSSNESMASVSFEELENDIFIPDAFQAALSGVAKRTLEKLHGRRHSRASAFVNSPDIKLELDLKNLYESVVWEKSSSEDAAAKLIHLLNYLERIVVGVSYSSTGECAFVTLLVLCKPGRKDKRVVQLALESCQSSEAEYFSVFAEYMLGVVSLIEITERQRKGVQIPLFIAHNGQLPAHILKMREFLSMFQLIFVNVASATSKPTRNYDFLYWWMRNKILHIINEDVLEMAFLENGSSKTEELFLKELDMIDPLTGLTSKEEHTSLYDAITAGLRAVYMLGH